MFKIYQKYIIRNFLGKYLTISLIFFILVLILNIFEEISFFKKIETNFFFPYFLTFLNSPILLFEIFPFIFFITTQFFFYDLFRKDEINLLKKNGLNNLKIIKVLILLSFVVGIFNLVIYYNIASILKFNYLNIKNSFSKDNKYLAMVTDNGLWIKDDIGQKKYIIKSRFISDKFLLENVITEFDSDFNLTRTIQSNKIDISEFNWNIINPMITINNKTEYLDKNINIQTNFNSDKINKIFSNFSSYNILSLLNLTSDYKKLGYSTYEANIHLLKLFALPLFYVIFTLFSAIIMFNFTKNKSFFSILIIGILISVILYYINFIFNSLGTNGKLPIYPAVFFPIFIISVISIIGLININEK